MYIGDFVKYWHLSTWYTPLRDTFKTKFRGTKWGINRGINRCIKWGIVIGWTCFLKGKLKQIMLDEMLQFAMPLICKIVFKNASPLGFMIVIYTKNRVHRGLKQGSYPLKTKLHRKKSKFTYDLLIFMPFLSKILENDFLSDMRRFRKFFDMIFHSGNVPLSKIQAHCFMFFLCPLFSA